jgi:hypothetical protein
LHLLFPFCSCPIFVSSEPLPFYLFSGASRGGSFAQRTQGHGAGSATAAARGGKESGQTYQTQRMKLISQTKTLLNARERLQDQPEGEGLGGTKSVKTPQPPQPALPCASRIRHEVLHGGIFIILALGQCSDARLFAETHFGQLNSHSQTEKQSERRSEKKAQ